MKLITEYTETNVQCIVEKKEDGSKSHVIEGVFMQAESKNRNGRIYPKPIMEKAVDKYVSEQVSKNRDAAASGAAAAPRSEAAQPDPADP